MSKLLFPFHALALHFGLNIFNNNGQNKTSLYARMSLQDGDQD